MDKLNEIGRTIFNTFYGLSYWVIAVIGIKEVLKAATNHDKDGIVKALTMVALSYSAIFAVTIILDIIKEVMTK